MLPISRRLYATRAADGSIKDIEKVAALITHEPHLSPRFLPVIFARLDPTLIPCPDSLDTTDPPQELVRVFSLALRALACHMGMMPPGSVPYAAFVDLWPRVWVWMKIIECHSHILSPSQAAGPQLVASLLQVMSDHRASDLIFDTPGMRGFFARTWLTMGPGEYNNDNFVPLATISTFMRTYKWTDARVQEFIDGSEITATALAARLVNDVRAGSSTVSLPTDLTEMRISCLAGVLHFARSTEHSPFLYALLSAGMTKAVTESLVPLSVSTAAVTEEAIAAALDFLTLAICVPSAYSYLREAGKAGLLRGIVALGNTATQDSEPFQHLQMLLHDVLPSSLMHPFVVSELASAVPEICPIAEAPFRSSPLYPLWTALIKLLNKRVLVLEYCKSEDYIHLRMCDECNCLKSAREIKRCSACKLQHYCSVACQRSAWAAGRHPQDCKDFQELEEDDLPTPVGLTLRKGTERFVRVVLHREYLERKREILLLQLDFMHCFPSVLFTTLFDYSMGACRISVVPLAEIDFTASLTRLPPGFETGVHHVILSVGGDVGNLGRTYILRSSSPTLATGLGCIVRLLPNGADVSQLEFQHPTFHQTINRLSEMEIGETHG
ncbi:hypothetical protein C8R43DRAFT_964902 [Mycena crocata]|nr:hypothetical protein C8R43DRAFT_964902 [Mycena crocata]